jgi:hypothetical protein
MQGKRVVLIDICPSVSDRSCFGSGLFTFTGHGYTRLKPRLIHTEQTRLNPRVHLGERPY